MRQVRIKGFHKRAVAVATLMTLYEPSALPSLVPHAQKGWQVILDAVDEYRRTQCATPLFHFDFTNGKIVDSYTLARLVETALEVVKKKRQNPKPYIDSNAVVSLANFGFVHSFGEHSFDWLVTLALTMHECGDVTYKSYNRYLEGDWWRSFRYYALNAKGGRCQLCGFRGDNLDVHHIDYCHIGQELFSDVTLLCRGCHWAHHKRQREQEAV